jgi:formylglycine-generating enzyme required for sulfatase activity
MKWPPWFVAWLIIPASGVVGQEPGHEPPKYITTHIGMKFVWIPPGNFVMGSPLEEKERHQDETQHKVTLTKGFYLGAYPVTQEQWQVVMGTNPSSHKGAQNLPVDNVSWDDCRVFLEKVSKKEGRAYRLPSEAEWEFACRAGTTTPFYTGQNISTDQANFNGGFSSDGADEAGLFRGETTPMGSFPANAWGLFDMHGNIWQWCADWYGEYPRAAVVDPHGLFAEPSGASGLIAQLSSPIFAKRQAAIKALKEMGPAAIPALRGAVTHGSDLETLRRVELLLAAIPKQRELRVLRGGSFGTLASFVRSATRSSAAPEQRYGGYGFRAALTPPAE